MAINPNTDFTAGAILTAAQQNRFPRGIMSFVEKTTNTSGVTAETIVVTMPAFTAVANRYYKITGFSGIVYTSPAASGSLTMKIRKGTTTGGTLLTSVDTAMLSTANGDMVTITWVGTLTAGSQQFVLTASSTVSASFFGAADRPLQFYIEDMGPA